MKTDKKLAPLNAIPNLIINEEKIKVKVINTNTNCYIESSFKLIISVLPKANSLEIIGCDNNDGISEYFDTKCRVQCFRKSNRNEGNLF
jgi:hypothetical protein